MTVLRRRRTAALSVLGGLVAAVLTLPGAVTPAAADDAPWRNADEPLDLRVDQLLAQLTLGEKVVLLRGFFGPPGAPETSFIPDIGRLGIPRVRVVDGPAGVRDGSGAPATALPAPIALGASFDTAVAARVGTVLGQETASRGFQVVYAPMVNLVRTPLGGRDFETYGEDPTLTGQIAASYITGVQSQKVAAQVKHYALNDQEDDRDTSDSVADERTEHELYLAPFETAVTQGNAWSTMCSYNKVNGTYACENFPLLRDVLGSQWGFDGVVATDYPAAHSTAYSALAGMGGEFGGSTYYAGLEKAVDAGQVPLAVVDDLTRRALRLDFRTGLLDGRPSPAVDRAANAAVVRQAAAAGTVLLKNDRKILPLNASALRSIAVVGPYADRAYTGGDGSSYVNPYPDQTVSPRAGIAARAGAGVTVTTDPGTDVNAAAAVARAADVAVVVVGDRSGEGSDRRALALTGNGNDLVAAVTAANPRTVVVLNTGAPVEMPWLADTHALVESWYGGEQTGNALADVLFGVFNPSGRLPETFPTSLAATPLKPGQYPAIDKTYTYSEKLLMGYRWYDANEVEPLFPFGFGLSYTTYAYSGLTVSPQAPSGSVDVSFDIANTGGRFGAEAAQVYVTYPASAGEPPRQLRGFTKVRVNAGAKTRATVTLSKRDLSIWDATRHGWNVPGGTYTISVGGSSANLPLTGTVAVRAEGTVQTRTGPVRGLAGKCADVAGANPADGTAVQLFSCNSTPAQRWALSSDGTIKAYGKCLTVPATANGSKAELDTCNRTANQTWRSVVNGGLRNVASGRCLDVTRSATDDGTRLQVWDCHGAPNQRWTIPTVRGTITGLADKCVDVVGAGLVDGTAVDLYDCNLTGAQDWELRADGTVSALGRCLEAPATALGTKVVVQRCTGSAAQRWSAGPNRSLVNGASGRCLDVTERSPANGTPLQLWECTGVPNQQWTPPGTVGL